MPLTKERTSFHAVPLTGGMLLAWVHPLNTLVHRYTRVYIKIASDCRRTSMTKKVIRRRTRFCPYRNRLDRHSCINRSCFWRSGGLYQCLSRTNRPLVREGKSCFWPALSISWSNKWSAPITPAIVPSIKETIWLNNLCFNQHEKEQLSWPSSRPSIKSL